jgi:hypothetical protein
MKITETLREFDAAHPAPSWFAKLIYILVYLIFAFVTLAFLAASILLIFN